MQPKTSLILGVIIGFTTTSFAIWHLGKSRIIAELAEKRILFNEPIKAKSVIPPENLSRKQLTDDIEKIRELMRNAYAGSIGLPKVQLNRLDQDLRQLLTNAKDLNNTVDACIMIHDFFSRTDDRHLNLKIGNLKCTPENTRKLQQIISTKKIPGKHERFVWQAKQKTINNRNLGYLSLNTFPSPDDKAWHNFYSSFIHSLESDILVLDLRENSGGWIISASKLSSHFHLPHAPIYSFNRVSSFMSVIMRVNIINHYFLNSDLDWQTYKKSADKAAATNIELIKKMDRKLEKSELWEYRTKKSKKSYLKTLEKADKQFTGEIIVLTGKGCASTCEFLVDYFKQHPKATVIGDNTMGAFHFIDNGVYVLPRSRMVLKMGHSYVEREENGYTGNKGISPELSFEQLDEQTKHFINAFIKE